MEKPENNRRRRLVVDGKEIDFDRVEDLPDDVRQFLSDADGNGLPDFIEKAFSPDLKPKELLEDLAPFLKGSKREISWSQTSSRSWDLKDEDIPDHLREKIRSMTGELRDGPEIQDRRVPPATTVRLPEAYKHFDSPDNRGSKKGWVQSVIIVLLLIAVAVLLAMQFGYLA